MNTCTPNDCTLMRGAPAGSCLDRLFVCACMYACMHGYICVCVCLYVYMCVIMCCVCTHIYKYVWEHVCHVCMQACVGVHMYVCKQVKAYCASHVEVSALSAVPSTQTKYLIWSLPEPLLSKYQRPPRSRWSLCALMLMVRQVLSFSPLVQLSELSLHGDGAIHPRQEILLFQWYQWED